MANIQTTPSNLITGPHQSIHISIPQERLQQMQSYGVVEYWDENDDVIYQVKLVRAPGTNDLSVYIRGLNKYSRVREEQEQDSAM